MTTKSPLEFTRAEALLFITKNPRWLCQLSEKFRDDDEIVGIAVAATGHSLSFASKRLRSDREMVKLAIKTNARALSYACEELRNDPDMRTYAFIRAGKPFIVDPIAMEVFSVLDLKMINSTVKTDRDGNIVCDQNGLTVYDEQKMHANPFYKRFKKFYDGQATAADILEYEKILLSYKRKHLGPQLQEFEDEYSF